MKAYTVYPLSAWLHRKNTDFDLVYIAAAEKICMDFNAVITSKEEHKITLIFFSADNMFPLPIMSLRKICPIYGSVYQPVAVNVAQSQIWLEPFENVIAPHPTSTVFNGLTR